MTRNERIYAAVFKGEKALGLLPKETPDGRGSTGTYTLSEAGGVQSLRANGERSEDAPPQALGLARKLAKIFDNQAGRKLCRICPGDLEGTVEVITWPKSNEEEENIRQLFNTEYASA